MSSPTEHKTVQARILEYAEAIHLRDGYGGQVGWTFLSEEKKVIGDSRLEVGEGKKRRGIGDWKLECGVSASEFDTGEATSWHGRRQIGDRREDLDSESLSSLRSLRFISTEPIPSIPCSRNSRFQSAVLNIMIFQYSS
jgi:hypothetical protein